MSVFKRWNGEQWVTIGPGISSARFENINNIIAPEYDPQKTYNIGDYIVQSDKLYKCIYRISTPQTWIPENWLEVKLGPEITELRNNVVAVSNTQPTNENNRIWVKPDNNDIKIPLVEDVMMLPSANNYGENDQIPRSTGTGIEWVYYGLPSDQQTEDAINAWLDDHPEATTTVQDHSLTYKKLVNGTLNFVTPEMYGAYGDGIHNDANAVANALRSELPVLCNGTYLVSNINQIDNLNKIELYGGTFLFNNQGTDDWLYITNTNTIIIKNINIKCTDSGFSGDTSKGTAFATYKCKNVFLEDIKAENINFLYRANYQATNDNTQFFMESININNILLIDCICPFLLTYCKNVMVTNISCLSPNEITRELFYIVGGIRNLSFDNIYADYSSRFYFHFNNQAVGVNIDNTLNQNWVEHFSLSNSSFEKSNNRSIIDPMCPVSKITVTNIYGEDPIFRSGNFTGCICGNIYISNSYIGSPVLDGGGKISEVSIENCVLIGAINQGSQTNPTTVLLKNNYILANRGSLGMISVYGKLIMLNNIIISTNEEFSQIIFSYDGEIILINNIFYLSTANRIIMNNSKTIPVICINNSINITMWNTFIHQTPDKSYIKNNILNNSIIEDTLTKINITNIELPQYEYSISINEELNLTPTLSPDNANNKDIIVQNSNSTIATATRTMLNGQPTCKIIGKTQGQTNVTIRSKENTNIAIRCTITVV